MVTKILVDTNFPDYNVSDGRKLLNNLSKINIFIGENNSGKSRFLRTIFSNNRYKIVDDGLSIDSIATYATDCTDAVTRVLKPYGYADLEFQVGNSHHRLIDYLEVKFAHKAYDKVLVSEIKKHVNELYQYGVKDIYITSYFGVNLSSYGNSITPQSVTQIKHILEGFTDNVNALIHNYEYPDYEKKYIPTLRGLRPIQNSPTKSLLFSNDDSYANRTQADYGFNSSENIFTGLNLYDDIRKHLLNTVDKRSLIQDFEKFISGTFFKDQTVSLIPHIDKDVLFIGIGDDDEREIYNLGDGIQALIIMLYPMFMNKGKNMLFCIEEPETHLHPGMQRIFLDALRQPDFDTFQFYITTHSNHFLDLTLDLNNISIYTFKKKKNVYEIENVSNDDNNILELIGVRNSSIFLSNCTIWVEGITDRLYLKKYIELYQEQELDKGNTNNKYLEDIHFSFVEYGGNNITHWSFLDEEEDSNSRINVKSICNKLFLITDNDGAKAAKKERFERLEKNLGENYYCLKAREIENLLSKDVIKRYIQKRENDNNIDFSTFDSDTLDYKKEPLGEFIETHVGGIKRKYKDNSGTIYNKVEFCKHTIEEIKDYSNLTEEARALASLVYNFIKKHNQ